VRGNDRPRHQRAALYSPSGTLVAQRIFSGQTFAAGEAKSYRWELPVPPTFVQGEYTIKVVSTPATGRPSIDGTIRPPRS
jgi:hypothetical protein